MLDHHHTSTIERDDILRPNRSLPLPVITRHTIHIYCVRLRFQRHSPISTQEQKGRGHYSSLGNMPQEAHQTWTSFQTPSTRQWNLLGYEACLWKEQRDLPTCPTPST
jgi:hypothetical protein